MKVLFWDGNGLCLFARRIDQGSFVWPVMAGYDGPITLTPAQLAMQRGNRLARARACLKACDFRVIRKIRCWN
ncbi:MAG: IS66 family insertion sequence element accessory protein TnpB [Bradyrhizobium sp.]